MADLLDRTVVVLVQPQHPGNVGAAARAMKNMGLSRLVVVDPPAYDPEQARWMAPGCDDLLAATRIVATLDEALEGCHVAVASTARHRKQGQPVLTPTQIAERMTEDDRTWAILFGREDFGLATEDVLRCESILRIPTPEHASLNLAQAVLLVANALFTQARAQGTAAPGRTLGGSRGRSTTAAKAKGDKRDALADLRRIEPAVDDLVELLERVGYFRSTPEPKVRLTARQALQRSQITIRHLEALRGMVNRTRWALENPGIDPRATRDRDPET
ncbi:MAG: TrmJ/YjtD family RNA methyltransferase [Alphaproteobacteria bacterium]|nr:TrmJ/YjtD family RNA methyltransferase [Alphaproteobacteria bacterium]